VYTRGIASGADAESVGRLALWFTCYRGRYQSILATYVYTWMYRIAKHSDLRVVMMRRIELAYGCGTSRTTDKIGPTCRSLYGVNRVIPPSSSAASGPSSFVGFA
jgi:N-methylhydantoinase A/oxoprolinase/acetone carboxylase beta subunit